MSGHEPDDQKEEMASGEEAVPLAEERLVVERRDVVRPAGRITIADP